MRNSDDSREKGRGGGRWDDQSGADTSALSARNNDGGGDRDRGDLSGRGWCGSTCDSSDSGAGGGWRSNAGSAGDNGRVLGHVRRADTLEV